MKPMENELAGGLELALEAVREQDPARRALLASAAQLILDAWHDEPHASLHASNVEGLASLAAKLLSAEGVT